MLPLYKHCLIHVFDLSSVFVEIIKFLSLSYIFHNLQRPALPNNTDSLVLPGSLWQPTQRSYPPLVFLYYLYSL